ncbi:hypothetical protein [Streptomyces flaveolus]|uniref:hypothetical protein n=1 Tax=Streptomyces flaveolus TaxID=67297 RepID=UPI0036F787F3
MTRAAPARRQHLVDAFQHDPDPAPVFILSVKAAGTGPCTLRLVVNIEDNTVTDAAGGELGWWRVPGCAGAG